MEQRQFGPIVVMWKGDVLHPRPWTLAQSEWAAALARDAPAGPILELFAGVGHIGLATAKMSGRRLVQVELDTEGCEWARRNAEAAGLASLVEVRCGDAEEVIAADERFGIVLADPPYLPSDQVDRFPDDPPSAVDGGPDGLDLVRLALRLGGAHLAPGGSLVLQLRGDEQADEVRAWLAAEDLGLAVTDVRVEGEDRALARVVPAPSGRREPALPAPP